MSVESRSIQECGFCSVVSALVRRVMCVGSRRGSTDSFYRGLGEQDTLNIADKVSDLSDEGEVATRENEQVSVPEASPSSIDRGELANMTKKNLCTGRFLTMHKRRRKRLTTRSLYQESALLDDIQTGQVECILNQSVQWKFNAFTLENVSGGRCLPVLCVHLFHVYGLLTHFNLDAAKAWKLFSLIEEGYHSTNPYHNSIHAADVTQAMHCFLQQKQIRDHLEPLEIMASLLAAIAHDIDHPGVNQPFLIATSNHLASLYKNTSVLENHHWRSAISCLVESGLLDQTQDIREKLESLISALILATDITRQKEYLSRFKNHLDTNTLDMTKSEHRILVLQIALKCADISNPCRPWEISRKWSLKVCEEFFRQGDYERKMNLPVTALCDRHTTSIPKIQTGFLKYVVTPLISEWHRFLQNDLSSQMVENLSYNQKKWETLMAQEIEEESRTEISEADIADEELETASGTNISGSSEYLLPVARNSLVPVKEDRPGSFKEHLRRFSVPLNVFQDSKYKNREKGRESSGADSRNRNACSITGSELSIHSLLSITGHCEYGLDPLDKELSTEMLLPDTSIASITTPVIASRLNTVIREGCSWKLIRQKTFPPLDMTVRAGTLASRLLHNSNEDVIFPSRFKTEFGQKFVEKNKKDERLMLKRNDTNKTDNEDASESSKVDVKKCMPKVVKENWEPFKRSSSVRRETSETGNQLLENITSAQLAVIPSDLLKRRKSMPADTIAQRERKARELAESLPQFLRRTLSGRECWSKRRSSAPAPVAPSELRGLASGATARHSENGNRRKNSLNPVLICQQWLSKTASNFDKGGEHKLRRSSLPAQVYLASDSNNVKSSESK